jgi:hypothetical protein
MRWVWVGFREARRVGRGVWLILGVRWRPGDIIIGNRVRRPTLYTKGHVCLYRGLSDEMIRGKDMTVLRFL